MPLVRTLAEGLRLEIPKIRGSRFIATAERVESSAQAMAFLERLRQEFADATHNCFAWVLDAQTLRSSDDGEPAGTAGRPILQEIQGRDLVEVAVVVTRYYGGTKLGTGGLIRAYGEAAGTALDQAQILEVPVVKTLRLVYGYEFSGAVKGVLTARQAIPGTAEYGAMVDQEVAVPIENLEACQQDLVDATHGRIRFIDPR